MKKIMLAMLMAPLAFTQVGFAMPNAPVNNANTEINAGQTETQVTHPRHGRGRWCRPGYVRRCHSIRTPIGIIIRNCRNVWTRCARRGGWGGGWGDDGWDGGWNVAQVQTVAEKYQLNYEDADAMIMAIKDAKGGDAEALNALSAELELDQKTVEDMTANVN